MSMGMTLFDYLDDTATFTSMIPEYEGMFYKKASKQIVADLVESRVMFHHEDYPH